MDPLHSPVLLLPEEPSDSGRAGTGFTAPRGWQVQEGFDLPAQPWDLSPSRLLCIGTVADPTDAEAAMTAAARGAGLALRLTLRGGARHRFLDDLHKVSQPEPYAGSEQTRAKSLSVAQHELLDALAAGATVTAAATAQHVSRRTANRLLADARAQLGADTTADAVRRWIAEQPRPPRPSAR